MPVRDLEGEGFHLQIDLLEDHAQIRAQFRDSWLARHRREGEPAAEFLQRGIMTNFPRDLCPLMPPNVWIKLTEIKQVSDGVDVGAVLVYWLPQAQA